MWDNYIYVRNVPAKIYTTTLTVSNVQPNIQRHAFVYVNIVHMEVDDAVVSQKHHLCWYIFDSSWLTNFFQTRPKLHNLIIENRVKISCLEVNRSWRKTIHWLLRYIYTQQ